MTGQHDESSGDYSSTSTVPSPVGGLPGERCFLLVLAGEGAFTYELPPIGDVIIGRGRAADLRLSEAGASRQHARLVMQRDHAQLVDLDSQNGTHVNGARLTAPHALTTGDIISIGGTTLVFRSDARKARGHAAPQRQEPGPPQMTTRQVGDRRVIIADPKMRHLFTLLERLAQSDIPVLICGETGTGKEIAAQAIHEWSPRKAKRIVSLNCAVLPETLIESELFGHEKGAFSGAVTSRAGLLEAASGGTVFLDEVGELSMGAQAKLLRVLETRRLIRVGDVRERAIDIRLVAATNRDLEQEVLEGRFRRDLYYRLSTATMSLPPLRERPCELPLLAQAFLGEASASLEGMTISDEVVALFQAYPWPGNLRELRNLMHYVAATTTEAVLRPQHLPARITAARERAPSPRAEAPPAPPSARAKGLGERSGSFRPLEEEIRELERARIVAALEAADGVQIQAAQLINMPLRTFVSKVKQYGLNADRSLRRGQGRGPRTQ